MIFMCDIKFKEMTGLQYQQIHDFVVYLNETCLYLIKDKQETATFERGMTVYVKNCERAQS
jgi:hypothetical protein